MVTLTSVEALADESYRIEGTFSATLTFHPCVVGAPVPDDILAIEGAFVIGRLPREVGD